LVRLIEVWLSHTSLVPARKTARALVFVEKLSFFASSRRSGFAAQPGGLDV
jgi:hypothetical protein